MVIKLLRITFLIVLCLSLAGKVWAKDSCENSKLLQDKSVISYNDTPDSSDCEDCQCHCHHNHFDFVFLSKQFDAMPKMLEKFSFDLASFLDPQVSSPKKPPKIVI